MGAFSPVLIAGGVAYGVAIVAWPLLNIRRRIGSVLSVVAAGLVLLCPLLIPREQVVARALFAIPCGDLFFKMVDYARQARRSGRGRWADYGRFLGPFPLFLVVFRERDRRLSARVPALPEIVRVILGVAGFSICLGVVMSGLAVVRTSFLLDHSLKFVIFIVTIESGSQALHGLERLAGYDIEPIIRNCVLARTPLEFWWRYNTRVHFWLEWNVFRPAGGRRSPARGVLATFFVSAIFHELMFDIAISRVDGYQFAFFMMQAPAVLASPRLERFARRFGVVGDALARVMTVLWMFATSIFFFRGVGRIFPFFYASEPWLP